MRDSPGANNLRQHIFVSSLTAQLPGTARSVRGPRAQSLARAPLSSRSLLLPQKSGAMRGALRTALVPRLPAPCHVATQGLPASARLSGSAPSWVAALRALRFAQARASAAASPRWPCAKPPPLPGSSHGSLRAWLPFGPARALNTPSRRERVLRAVRWVGSPAR